MGEAAAASYNPLLVSDWSLPASIGAAPPALEPRRNQCAMRVELGRRTCCGLSATIFWRMLKRSPGSPFPVLAYCWHDQHQSAWRSKAARDEILDQLVAVRCLCSPPLPYMATLTGAAGYLPALLGAC